MGASGVPTPTPGYAETASALYLEPSGFSGTTEVLTTPELFTSLTQRQLSESPGAAILTQAIEQKLADGAVSAQQPLYVFGYSQSAAFSGLTMQQLHAAGVPSENLHFVLVGDPATPNGGFYTTFGVADLGDSFNDTTPDNLYPTDVYTLEYDLVADFPRNPLNLLSSLNAAFGLVFKHLAYLGLTPEQIANAVPLAVTGDPLAHYFVIPSADLPILDPLTLIPVIGQPFYDLLEPATRILVNLGYGSITEGWNAGPANVVSAAGDDAPGPGLIPVLTALGNAVRDGYAAFLADLANPATYQVSDVVDSPALSELIGAAYAAGLIDTPAPDSIRTVLDAWLNFLDPPTDLIWQS